MHIYEREICISYLRLLSSFVRSMHGFKRKLEIDSNNQKYKLCKLSCMKREFDIYSSECKEKKRTQ